MNSIIKTHFKVSRLLFIWNNVRGLYYIRNITLSLQILRFTAVKVESNTAFYNGIRTSQKAVCDSYRKCCCICTAVICKFNCSHLLCLSKLWIHYVCIILSYKFIKDFKINRSYFNWNDFLNVDKGVYQVLWFKKMFWRN